MDTGESLTFPQWRNYEAKHKFSRSQKQFGGLYFVVPAKVSQLASLSASSHPSVPFFKAGKLRNNLPYN